MDNIKAAKTFLVLGELMNQEKSREDKLKYEERIVFATMKASIPDWTPPSDWYELSIEERENRINKFKMI